MSEIESSAGSDVGAQVVSHLQIVLEFMPRADAKAQYIIAVSSAMLAVLVTNLPGLNLLGPLALVAIPAICALGRAMYCSFRALTPSLAGGMGSLVYFKSIAELKESEFMGRYMAQDRVALAKDMAEQVWRNSVIASSKFAYVHEGFVALGVGVIFWIAALSMLVVGYGSADSLIRIGA